MADLAAFTITIDVPDLRPADVGALHEAADALPFGHEELQHHLHDLAGRVARMLLAATMRPTPSPEPDR